MLVPPMLVIVEGNISAGKSTLSRDLGEITGYRVFYEPTLTNPYLESFYANPKAYALKMQLWLLHVRFHTYIEAVKYVISTGKGVILDRSVYSDCVFAEKNFLDGNFDEEGYRYYRELRAKMLQTLPTPHATVYLDTSPLTCYERVHHLRGRDCESGIKLEYLEGLDMCYKNMIADVQSLGSRVFTYSWDEFGNVRKVRDDLLAFATTVSMDDLRTRAEILYNEVAVREAVTMSWSIADSQDLEPVPHNHESQPARQLPPSPSTPKSRRRSAPLDASPSFSPSQSDEIYVA